MLLCFKLVRDRRVFEATIAILVLFMASKASFQSLPRYMIGTPVFLMAFHDCLSSLKGSKLKALSLVMLILVNLWLLSNWFENARFLL